MHALLCPTACLQYCHLPVVTTRQGDPSSVTALRQSCCRGTGSRTPPRVSAARLRPRELRWASDGVYDERTGWPGRAPAWSLSSLPAQQRARHACHPRGPPAALTHPLRHAACIPRRALPGASRSTPLLPELWETVRFSGAWGSGGTLLRAFHTTPYANNRGTFVTYFSIWMLLLLFSCLTELPIWSESGYFVFTNELVRLNDHTYVRKDFL